MFILITQEKTLRLVPEFLDDKNYKSNILKILNNLYSFKEIANDEISIGV